MCYRSRRKTQLECVHESVFVFFFYFQFYFLDQAYIYIDQAYIPNRMLLTLHIYIYRQSSSEAFKLAEKNIKFSLFRVHYTLTGFVSFVNKYCFIFLLFRQGQQRSRYHLISLFPLLISLISLTVSRARTRSLCLLLKIRSITLSKDATFLKSQRFRFDDWWPRHSLPSAILLAWLWR